MRRRFSSRRGGTYRRRFKPKLQWFPTIGTDIEVNQESVGILSGIKLNLLIDPNGDPTTYQFPLTFDQSQDEQLQNAIGGGATPSLSDLQNESWRLRRCVGKFFASFLTEDTTLMNDSSPPAVLVGAGLMVNKVDPNGAPLVTNLTPQQWNVLSNQTITDPWIWRRVWLLGQNYQQWRSLYDGAISPGEPRNAGEGGVDEVGCTLFPQTTADFGSAEDGPHFDAKTNRIIGPDDRLFLWITTQAYPGDTNLPYEVGGGVFGYVDYRLLGSLMKSTNRRNASR